MTSPESHEAALRHVAGMDVPDGDLLAAIVELADERARALTALVVSLRDEERELRLRAARGLADPRAGVPPVVAALERSATEDVNLRVRAAAADALGAIGALGALADLASNGELDADDGAEHRDRLERAIERLRADGELLRSADAWWPATASGGDLLWRAITAPLLDVTLMPSMGDEDVLFSETRDPALKVELKRRGENAWTMTVQGLAADVSELLLRDPRLVRSPVLVKREPALPRAPFLLDDAQAAYVRAAAAAGTVRLACELPEPPVDEPDPPG